MAFATEFPKGLACKQRCEADVQKWIQLSALDQKLSAVASALLRSQNNNAIVSATFCLLAGGGFIYFTGLGGGLSLPSFMGAAFFCYGVVALARALRVRSKR